MQAKHVIANWKAYITTQKQLRAYFDVFWRAYPQMAVLHKATIRLSSGKAAVALGKKSLPPEVVFCVPAPLFYKTRLTQEGRSPHIHTGAQDVFWESSGPFTGAVTPAMVKDAGMTHVILGHSERRKYFGDTDETVQKKLSASLAAKLIPILCVGEWERAQNDEEEKEVLDFVKNQLQKALQGVKSQQLKNIIIAYEPVWAISGNQGAADSPEGALRMIMFIRRILAKLYDARIAKKIPVIYGGSVNAQNVAAFVRHDAVDGVLVGSASANPKEFLKILAEIGRIR